MKIRVICEIHIPIIFLSNPNVECDKPTLMPRMAIMDTEESFRTTTGAGWKRLIPYNEQGVVLSGLFSTICVPHHLFEQLPEKNGRLKSLPLSFD